LSVKGQPRLRFSGKRGERIKMKNRVEELCLRPWEEIVGTCVDAIEDEAAITLVIKIVPKAQTLKLHLHGLTVKVKDLVGQPIAIIRTDDNKHPFLIRRLNSPATSVLRAHQQPKDH